MISKTIHYKNNLIKDIRKGLLVTSKILSLTLGPRGKNIVLWDRTTQPLVLNDGTAIVNKLYSLYFTEHVGQFIIKDVLHDINDSVGDGTSTTGVLVSHIISNGLTLTRSGFQPKLFLRGLNIGNSYIKENLFSVAWPLFCNKEILNIATNSAGGDLSLGKLVVQAFKKVGTEGLISIETCDKKTTSLKIYGGLQIDRGYVSHKFINNIKNSSCELKECAVLVTDTKIKTLKEAINIMRSSLEINKPLLLISDEIAKKPLVSLLNNVIKKKINFCAVKIPSFGVYRKAILQDIAIATGARYISTESGDSFDDKLIPQLGYAKKCVVHENSCTIVAKNKYKSRIKERLKFLRVLLQASDSTFEIQQISERIAKLSGGIAVLQLGASTEIELNDKKLRLEDAKNATFASLTQGVVPGSAISLVHFSNYLKISEKYLQIIGENMGLELFLKSILMPNRCIINNSNFDSITIEKEILKYPFEIGFDAENQCITNIISEGIVDPSLLVYNSLNTAKKVTSVVLNARAAVSIKKVDNLGKKNLAISHLPPVYSM